VCGRLPDLPEEAQVLVVQFLCASYRPGMFLCHARARANTHTHAHTHTHIHSLTHTHTHTHTHTYTHSHTLPPPQCRTIRVFNSRHSSCPRQSKTLQILKRLRFQLQKRHLWGVRACIMHFTESLSLYMHHVSATCGCAVSHFPILCMVFSTLCNFSFR
jgi:hypothetical protein